MNAAKTASNTAANFGGVATAEGDNARNFLTQEMLHPQGVGQQGLSAETAAATGGAGGAASGLTGQAIQRAAVTRNGGAANAVLGDIARDRMKAAAGASEEIAANNEQLKQQQQQEGAAGLQKMYDTDTSGMLQAMGQEAPDVNAAVNADNSGWLQNATNLLSTLNGAGTAAGSLGWKPFAKGR